MKLPLPRLTLACLGLLSTRSSATDTPNARGISINASELVNLLESPMSSVIGEVNSAYTSMATKLPGDLLSQISAPAWPRQTATPQENRAPSELERRTVVLYGVATVLVALSL
ncbi:hypothetical protein HBH53_262730 [Parastagonospora nodorum]|nr:hypothetical protein HBH53_262730 [Parastagonospora nodorum]KAH5045769.1 hypothetical protein HBI73_251510 [Parastagonospora nodorum]KAH5087800.1 hypothetical protein HBH72_251240 [Parastagonospora nodorum]KAH5545316.1 hypothetical protein HBI26_254500 [Parastagonospora nodorum]KAH5702842.1 hypothetical protein HBI20_252630 [Parastagonospora nodorum]